MAILSEGLKHCREGAQRHPGGFQADRLNARRIFGGLPSSASRQPAMRVAKILPTTSPVTSLLLFRRRCLGVGRIAS